MYGNTGTAAAEELRYPTAPCQLPACHGSLYTLRGFKLGRDIGFRSFGDIDRGDPVT